MRRHHTQREPVGGQPCHLLVITPFLYCYSKEMIYSFVIRNLVRQCLPGLMYRKGVLFFCLLILQPPRSTLFPFSILFRFFLKDPRPTEIPSLTPHAVFPF